MKLIYCSACGEVISLAVYGKSCRCGQSCGRDKNDVAIISGAATPISFKRKSFSNALYDKGSDGRRGLPFWALVLPDNCKAVDRTTTQIVFAVEVLPPDVVKKHWWNSVVSWW